MPVMTSLVSHGREQPCAVTGPVWGQPACRVLVVLLEWPVSQFEVCTGSCHAGLDQWEQEVKLYVSLKQLRLFRQHKLWKAFKCWKSAIDSNKLAGAKGVLNKQLFLLSPVFQQPLQQFHALCHELSSMRLHCIQQGQVRGRGTAGTAGAQCKAGLAGDLLHVCKASSRGSPTRCACTVSCVMSTQVYSLEQFAQQHSQQVQACAHRLAQFSEAAFDIVQGACRDDLIALQQHLETFRVRADGNATAPAATSAAQPVSPAAVGTGSSHISVTELLKSRSSIKQQRPAAARAGSATKPGDSKSAQEVSAVVDRLAQILCDRASAAVCACLHEAAESPC